MINITQRAQDVPCKDDKVLDHIHNLPKGGDASLVTLSLYLSSVLALPSQFKFLEDYGYHDMI